MWVWELKRAKTYYSLITTGQMLAHLQATYGGLHALNVLALQNKKQHYHLDSKIIPEYIIAQSKAERANNPITGATLVIIATNEKFSTEQFPQANEYWEELDTVHHT